MIKGLMTKIVLRDIKVNLIKRALLLNIIVGIFKVIKRVIRQAQMSL
jgi:hypothetical protein